MLGRLSECERNGTEKDAYDTCGPPHGGVIELVGDVEMQDIALVGGDQLAREITSLNGIARKPVWSYPDILDLRNDERMLCWRAWTQDVPGCHSRARWRWPGR